MFALNSLFQKDVHWTTFVSNMTDFANQSNDLYENDVTAKRFWTKGIIGAVLPCTIRIHPPPTAYDYFSICDKHFFHMYARTLLPSMILRVIAIAETEERYAHQVLYAETHTNSNQIQWHGILLCCFMAYNVQCEWHCKSATKLLSVTNSTHRWRTWTHKYICNNNPKYVRYSMLEIVIITIVLLCIWA